VNYAFAKGMRNVLVTSLIKDPQGPFAGTSDRAGELRKVDDDTPYWPERSIVKKDMSP
jgi:hypothetical protein